MTGFYLFPASVELLYATGKIWPMHSAQESLSPGSFSTGHMVLTTQIIPGVKHEITLGSCTSMQNRGKHPCNIDRLDKLETAAPEPERQIPLPTGGFLSPRLTVIPLAGRNGAPSVHIIVRVTLTAALLQADYYSVPSFNHQLETG